MLKKSMAALALATVVAGFPALHASAARARPAWRVTVSANTTTVTLGHKVHLHGRVRPTAAGRYVRLEEQYAAGKPWRLQRQARIRSDGSYTTFDKPTQNHSRLYRVVVPGTRSHARGVSLAVSVSVYQWVQLTSLPALNGNGINAVSALNINAVTYPGSLKAYPADPASTTAPPAPVSVEYNINHKCTALRATYGLSDDSASGAQGTVSLLVDGAAAFSGTFGVGQSQVQRLDFTAPPLKLHFAAQSLSAGVAAYPAIGTPKVLCTQ